MAGQWGTEMQLDGPGPWSSEHDSPRALRALRDPHVPGGRRLIAGIVTFAVAVAIAIPNPTSTQWIGLARAQQPQRLSVTVASVVRVESASRVRLPIQVGPPDALPKNSFIRIRGLPQAAALSEGHAIAPGAWAVPLTSLRTLDVILPAGVQGDSNIVIGLVSADGDILAEAKAVLAVSPSSPPPAARQASPPIGARSAVLPPSAERERALGLHTKGVEQLERGNVYAARKFFERAAEAGLAQSAVALAGTYDPDELAKMRVVGMQPNIEAARKWYEKARELGAVEASERLRRLGAR